MYATEEFQSPFGDFLICKGGKSQAMGRYHHQFQSPFGDFLICKQR